MPKDVLITPASGLIDFKDAAGGSDATIQLDDLGNLNITNSAGVLSIGNTAANVYIGDGTNSVDIIFEQSGKIRALTNKTLTLGQSDSFVSIASPTAFLSPDGTKSITARMLNTDVLSFQGGAGELLSLSDSMTGTIYSVNDVSGIPSIDVSDTGLVRLAPYGGAVSFGNNTGTAGQVLLSQGSSSPPTWGSAIPLWSKKTSAYTAVNGDYIIADTTAGVFTITLPATPSLGNVITIVDGNNWKTNNLTIARNGSTIEGLAEDLTVNIGGIRIDIVYDGTTWEVYTSATASDVASQTGNSGKFLTTNGTTTSWSTVSLPAGQTSGSTTAGYLQYNGTTKASGQLDGGTTAPSNTTRLNYDGYLYATKFYGDGSSLTGISAGATITDDNTTNAIRYILFDDVTSGSATTVGVSSSKLYFNPSTGTLNATNFNSLSDVSLKENIKKIDSNILDKINPVEFTWKDNGRKSYGVIAQEIEQILPEIVDTNDKGIKSVSYSQLIPFLIGAVKDLQEQVNQLKKEMDNVNS